jgi:Clostripain family
LNKANPEDILMRENGKPNHSRSRNAIRNLEKKSRPKWTVMVYLGGDNNLTANCITVLQQLEAVKYTDDVCVLACFDSNTPWPKGSRYLAINCRRREVNNGIDWEIHNDLIPPDKRGHDFEPPDFCDSPNPPKGHEMRTGVAEGLKRFLYWTMKNHGNSEHYMLMLYGHGPLVASQTFLVRENPQSALTLAHLRRILKPHFGPERKLDILAFQNCAMNGIETAYEVKDQVDMTIGSQGLVLAAGWPYDKIITAVVENADATPDQVGKELLKRCARHLLDFSVMDRSSEQSLCKLSNMHEGNDMTMVVRRLVRALEEGLSFDAEAGRKGVLNYPAICDAVRLARLEAQSYWGETFVDLYDFCERLLKKCNEAVITHNALLEELQLNGQSQSRLRRTGLLQQIRKIIGCCIDVMNKVKDIVKASYYIGCELQYSHGISVFFPWTMPGQPYTFVRVKRGYLLKPVFEIYRQSRFAKESRWADFLQVFFKATIRKVRRADRDFSLRQPTANLSSGFVGETIHPLSEVLTSDLQKSGSDSGITDLEVWTNIKNYPRRNYLYPSDCERKILTDGCQTPGSQTQFPNETSPPVSYLGWNLSGLVAEVISKPSNGKPPSVRTKRPAQKAPVPGNRRKATSRRS